MEGMIAVIAFGLSWSAVVIAISEPTLAVFDA